MSELASIGFGLAAALAAVVIIAIFAERQEGQTWEQFAAQHNCKVMGHMSSSVSTGVGLSSRGSLVIAPVVTPDKTGYSCDDGKQYWR